MYPPRQVSDSAKAAAAAAAEAATKMKQEGGTLPTSGAGLLESENTAEEEAARGLSVCA